MLALGSILFFLLGGSYEEIPFIDRECQEACALPNVVKGNTFYLNRFDSKCKSSCETAAYAAARKVIKHYKDATVKKDKKSP